ncbi:MAG: ABC transporter ATP-binding protein [Chloroflexi bacterium]|nr:ABC transporter ATP-binding protein [Chloroflexota bacterium]
MRSDGLSTSVAPLLAIHAVSLHYPTGFHLGPLTLAVAPGERVALIGPNGAGKTTLLRLMAGVVRPSAGTVELDRRPLSALSRELIAQRIAVVPQTLQIPFAFTVAEVVALGRTARRWKRAGWQWREGLWRDEQAIAWAMTRTGASAFDGRVFNELSAGEKQRVVLAMALAQEPELLLLDEPTAHLDIRAQLDVLSLVAELQREQRLTVVGVIHDLNLAAQFFNRLVLLSHGQVVADGPPDAVLRDDVLDQVFAASVRVVPHPDHAGPLVVHRRPGIADVRSPIASLPARLP